MTRSRKTSFQYFDEIVICCAAMVTIYSLLLPCVAALSIASGQQLAKFDSVHQLVLLFVILIGLLPLATGFFEHRDRRVAYLGVAGWLCLLLSIPSSNDCCGVFIACAAGEISLFDISTTNWLQQLLPALGGAMLSFALVYGTHLQRRVLYKQRSKSRR